MASHSRTAGRLTEQLPSGNHRLVCHDCGDVVSAATEDEALDTRCRCHEHRQPLRYVYVLDLTCSLCGRAVGDGSV
jgi:hypothetical protein